MILLVSSQYTPNRLLIEVRSRRWVADWTVAIFADPKPREGSDEICIFGGDFWSFDLDGLGLDVDKI